MAVQMYHGRWQQSRQCVFLRGERVRDGVRSKWGKTGRSLVYIRISSFWLTSRGVKCGSSAAVPIPRCRPATTLLVSAFIKYGTARTTAHSFPSHHRKCGIRGPPTAGSRPGVYVALKLPEAHWEQLRRWNTDRG